MEEIAMKRIDGFWVVVTLADCSAALAHYYPAAAFGANRAHDKARTIARVLGLPYRYDNRLYLIEW